MSGDSPRKARWQETVELLKAEITSTPSAELPAIYDLAQKWDVSCDTVRKAVKHLVAAGVLRCKAGRRITIVRGGVPGISSSSERGLFDKVKDDILEGRLRAGSLLPKVEFFSITYRVSPNIVCAMLRRLRDENLIYKSGKKWIVGRDPHAIAVEAHTSSQAPVILVVMADSSVLISAYNSFIEPFATTFSHEIGQFGFQPGLVLAYGGDTMLKGIPSGVDQILKLAQQLGNRYSGAIVMGLPEHVPDLKTLIIRLCKLTKPVAFFDHSSRCPDYNRADLKTGPHYHRLHTDDAGGLTLALRTLVDHGHRGVGMPVYSARSEFGWVALRSQQLRECIIRENLPLEIVTVPQEERFWNFFMFFSLEQFLLDFKVQSWGRADIDVDDQELVSRLIKETPSLSSLCADPKITAIIAPNDDMAREYHFWLSAVGVSVPEGMSLISFDNKAESQFLPITTIDFGFQNLGYRAAHIFINDLPVRTGRSGDLAGTCALMDRGSVGRPGKRSVQRFRY